LEPFLQGSFIDCSAFLVPWCAALTAVQPC
jgi:hypothetical protein